MGKGFLVEKGGHTLKVSCRSE
ncbi:hypothetical protein A2U01_0042796, partial [Trifolium medium]|nr:hypothetical protein [Trifolium medium]